MARQVKVDLSNVETFARVSEGQHVAKLHAIDEKDEGTAMLVAVFEVTKGADKGGRVYVNFPLAENALWKLKGFLQAIGIKADGKLRIDLDKLIGKTCLIDVSMDEYNGKERARIDSFKALVAKATETEDEDDEDEDEATPAPAPKKKAKPAPVVEDDDDDDEEDEPVAPVKKAKAAPAPAPVKKAKKPAPVVVDDDDEDDEDDEDEEEEEPVAPVKKAKKATPAPVAASAKKKAKKPADDDEEWDDED